MLPEHVIEELFSNPLDSFTWKEWKDMLPAVGITLMDDDSDYTDESTLTSVEARQQLMKCTIKQEIESTPLVQELVPSLHGPRLVEGKNEPTPKLSIGEWRLKFQHLMDNPPTDDFLVTEDGSPIKLEIELFEGKPPFIYTRAYVPMIVGAHLGWFAQREGDTSKYGWKVILVHKSRDECVKRLGIARNYVLVRELKIVKMAERGQSLLAEISQW